MGGGLQALIVVDNCEHVLDAAAEVVATILRHSSSVVVLATSRQPLDVDGERVWPVHPLPVGVAGSGGAVDLFLRRAADAGEIVAPDEHAAVGVDLPASRRVAVGGGARRGTGAGVGCGRVVGVAG